MQTETVTQEGYQAALDRLRDYRKQLQGADRQADRNSLDRARDLELLYRAMQWVDEIPAPKHQVWRGRPVDPRSRNRFASWIVQTTGLRPSTVRKLHAADEIAGIIVPSGTVIPGGEWALRPFMRLRRAGYEDHIIDVYRAAVQLADGDTPGYAETDRAVRDFLARYTPGQRQAASASVRLSKYRERITADFVYMLANDAQLAGATLNGLIDAYNTRIAGVGK